MNEAMPLIVPRYLEEDWLEWKSLCSDKMCASWTEWRAGIEKFLRNAAKNRATVHEVTIRPQGFRGWASENEKPLNGFSRGEYAGWLIKDRFLKPSSLPNKLPSHAEVNGFLRKALKANPDLQLSDISNPYLRRPEAGICPIFRQRGTEEIEQFGSGVLLRIADHHFLVSAGHVLDSFKSHPILIPGREHLIQIFGDYRVTPVPENGTRENDEIDVGYFHLKQGLEDQLHKDLLFLDETDCDAMDSAQEGDTYTVIGYPSENSESIDGEAITSVNRVTCGSAGNHLYKKLSLSPNSHLLLVYRMKKGVSQQTMIPGVKFDFGGMSGGGAFAWSKCLPDPRALAQPHLVGIVTAYAPHHNAVQITRLGKVLKGILREFPHLPLVERARH